MKNVYLKIEIQFFDKNLKILLFYPPPLEVIDLIGKIYIKKWNCFIQKDISIKTAYTQH